MSIAGDTVVQQFDSFLSLHGKSEEFLSFKSMEQRLSFTKLSTHLILSFEVSFNASCCYLMGKLR